MNAKVATDDGDRAAWLQLAEDWIELARTAENGWRRTPRDADFLA